MPIIKIIEDSIHGDFRIDFCSNVTFYGETDTSDITAFRRYGNLPHNNILVNKLINCLGNNLLSLEKKALELDARSLSPDTKRDIIFTLKWNEQLMPIRLFYWRLYLL